MSQGKATFATRFSHKCLVATREGESHFMNRKVLLLYFFYYQISQICNGMKTIVITPHFVRYMNPIGKIISNKVWVVIAIIHSMGMREPDSRIIGNLFPHFFICVTPPARGRPKDIKNHFMQQIEQFTQPATHFIKRQAFSYLLPHRFR